MHPSVYRRGERIDASMYRRRKEWIHLYGGVEKELMRLYIGAEKEWIRLYIGVEKELMRLYISAEKEWIRLYRGAEKELMRLYRGAEKELMRLYIGAEKELMRLNVRTYRVMLNLLGIWLSLKTPVKDDGRCPSKTMADAQSPFELEGLAPLYHTMVEQFYLITICYDDQSEVGHQRPRCTGDLALLPQRMSYRPMLVELS